MNAKPVREVVYSFSCDYAKAAIARRLLAYFGEVYAVRWLEIVTNSAFSFIVAGNVEILQEFRDELGYL